jgi:pimeloyl-ACP methyl ester carboxylesterase
LVEDALICQKEAWMGWYDHGRTVDFSDALSNISIPCFLIAGEHDQVASEKRIRTEISEKLSGSQLVVLRDAGHNLPVELPKGIAQIISRAATRVFHPVSS